MATKCNPIRTQLLALEEQLKNTPKYLDQPQGAPQQSEPQLNPQWVNLDSHLTRTRMALQACEETD